MNKYKVWLERFDYRNTQKINGDLMTWDQLQKLIGEKLLECESAKQTDVNSYTFFGKYLSAGDQYLDFGYKLDFEPYTDKE
jgi:hypothetical protein